MYVLVPSSRGDLRHIDQWLDSLLQAICSHIGTVSLFSDARMETGSPRLNMKPQPLQLVLEEQVLALQQQMAENQAASWRKLKSSQDAQKRQATLVRKLQAKVRQLPLWGRENESPALRRVLEWGEGWLRERPWRGMDQTSW